MEIARRKFGSRKTCPVTLEKSSSNIESPVRLEPEQDEGGTELLLRMAEIVAAVRNRCGLTQLDLTKIMKLRRQPFFSKMERGVLSMCAADWLIFCHIFRIPPELPVHSSF